MDSSVAVEREVDRALELFTGFYENVDDDIQKTIDFTIKNIEDLVKCNSWVESVWDNDNLPKLTFDPLGSDAETAKQVASLSSQLIKEQIKSLAKRYSEKHKDLHGSISKIGKVIDKVGSLNWPNCIWPNREHCFANQRASCQTMAICHKSTSSTPTKKSISWTRSFVNTFFVVAISMQQTRW